MRLACVIHRYGPDATGGSEAHCRGIAQRLAARHEVTVLTTCAVDYVTWANALAAGESRDGAVRVLRFPVARRRPLGPFWELSDLVFDEQASETEQHDWFRLNGPESPALLEYLERHAHEFDRVLFWSFRYYPTWFGLPLAAERAVLVPTAEEDPLIRTSTILGPFFASPRACLFLTPEERELVAARCEGPLPPSAVIGSGLDPADPAAPRALLRERGLPDEFFLYLGRVDRNKGCEALFELYAAYAAEHPAAEVLPLVLAGPIVLPVPEHPGMRALGRVDDALRDALLAHARAVVMPSPLESLSLVVLEAWNRATPVLVNGRCRPLRGQVERADGGLYYLLPGEFAAAAAFGRQGLAYVEREYRWDRVMRKVETVVETLAPPSELDRDSR